jgi:hypothetical protein
VRACVRACVRALATSAGPFAAASQREPMCSRPARQVSSTILRTFVCKTVEGVTYLQVDYAEECYDCTRGRAHERGAGADSGWTRAARWKTYATLSALMIPVYPIGIPAFFFFMMWRYVKYGAASQPASHPSPRVCSRCVCVRVRACRAGRLREPGVRAELGLLYDAYDPSMWWFEMVDMIHKLIVTSVLAFFPEKMQVTTRSQAIIRVVFCVITPLIRCAGAVRHGVCRRIHHSHPADPPVQAEGRRCVSRFVCVSAHARALVRVDKLHLLTNAHIFLVLYAGYLFYLNKEITKLIDVVLSVVLIAMLCFVFVYFCTQVFRAAWKARTHHTLAALHARADAAAVRRNTRTRRARRRARSPSVSAPRWPGRGAGRIADGADRRVHRPRAGPRARDVLQGARAHAGGAG